MVRVDGSDGRGGELAEVSASFTEERQDFGQDFFRRDDLRALQRHARGPGGGVALVLVVDEGHPVLGVREGLLHAVGRLGAPWR